MIADILYPIFTLKITVLAYLIQKNRGPRPHQSITMDALVGLQLPQYPQRQKKWCAHILSGLSPDHFK